MATLDQPQPRTATLGLEPPPAPRRQRSHHRRTLYALALQVPVAFVVLVASLSRSNVLEALPHGQSAPLGSARARLLHLLRPRLAALGGSALPE